MSEQGDDIAKAEAARELERYKVNEGHITELLKGTMTFEHAAISPVLYLNGGAL